MQHLWRWQPRRGEGGQRWRGRRGCRRRWISTFHLHLPLLRCLLLLRILPFSIPYEGFSLFNFRSPEILGAFGLQKKMMTAFNLFGCGWSKKRKSSLLTTFNGHHIAGTGCKRHVTRRANHTTTCKQAKTRNIRKVQANRSTTKNGTKNTLQAAAAVCGTSSIGRFYLLVSLAPCHPVCRRLPAFVNYAPPTERMHHAI